MFDQYRLSFFFYIDPKIFDLYLIITYTRAKEDINQYNQ